MTSDLLDLARRAVASPHWRWLPGMAWAVPPGSALERVFPNGRYPVPEGVAPLPDLSDAATLGCLLALVREAWRKPMLYVEAEVETETEWHTWYVSCASECRSFLAGMHDTEAAALVAALEAAPEVEQ